MSLATLARIAPHFVCPRCRSPVAQAQAAFRCSDNSCALSAPESFPVVGGCPILVDFEHSVLRREELAQESGTLGPRVSHRWALDRVPSRLRSWIKPPNEAARRNIEHLLSELPAEGMVLVVGGGTVGNGTERLYEDQQVKVIAFDIFRSRFVQFLADAHQIPLDDGSVDAVVVQAVLEHVLDPSQVVTEIHRVLRDGGKVYAETPFLQQVHAGPYDFVRFTGSGHRYLFRRFEELAAGPVGGPGTQFLWSIDHLVRGIARSELAGKLARALFFALRYLDRVVPEPYAIDDASAFYFLGRRSERELGPPDIIAYYRGAQRGG